MVPTVKHTSILVLVVVLSIANFGGLLVSSLPNFSDMLVANRCYVVLKPAMDIAISKIKLRFQYGPNADDHFDVPLNESKSILENPHFKNNSCIVVYVPGFVQPIEGKYTLMGYKDFVDAGYNLIVLDWSSVAYQEYTIAVGMMPSAAEAVAPAIDALLDSGATMCYMSGVSLGAQCLGTIMRNMRHRVGCAVGLDPAGPLMSAPLKCVTPLLPSDADYVEVIHSDAGMIGTWESSGTVDIWINTGRRTQPGCLNPFQQNEPGFICSHSRSQFVFMESQKAGNEELFPARKCSSYISFELNLCSNNPVIYMGRCNKTNPPGKYYLRTTGKMPYGLGMAGASPWYVAW